MSPEFQRKGIGRQLVNHIYTEYGLEKENVIVQTRAMSESFYLKLGWKTESCTDVDLSDWGGKGLGFGVHRSPQMIRYAVAGSEARGM